MKITDAQKRVLQYLANFAGEYRRINRKYSRTTEVLEKRGLIERSKKDMFDGPVPFGFPMQHTVWKITDAGMEYTSF